MTTFDELHQEAMCLAEQGDGVRKHDVARAKGLYAQAMEKERQALGLLAEGVEPSRSVLLRSAASLAVNAEDTVTARLLIEQALAGTPPRAILEELELLREEVVVLEEFSGLRSPAPTWGSFGDLTDEAGLVHRSPRRAA